MARITAPNKDYNGVSAGVRFVNGEAECSDSWTIEWFKTHGYGVDEGVERANSKRKPTAEPESGEDTPEAVGTTDEETLDKPYDDKLEGEAEEKVQQDEGQEETTDTTVKRRGKRTVVK